MGDPAAWHNRYPEEWARVAREAIEETGRADDIVFSIAPASPAALATRRSSGLGINFEAGTNIAGSRRRWFGLLSGGVSGFSLLHSDTGGSDSLQFHLAGTEIQVPARTPALQMRWTELNAFTVVLRTHEGLEPHAMITLRSVLDLAALLSSRC